MRGVEQLPPCCRTTWRDAVKNAGGGRDVLLCVSARFFCRTGNNMPKSSSSVGGCHDRNVTNPNTMTWVNRLWEAGEGFSGQERKTYTAATRSLIVDDIFIPHLEDFLQFVQVAVSMIASSAGKDLLRYCACRLMCDGVLFRILYDLAAQDHDEHCTDHNCLIVDPGTYCSSWKLGRLIVFACALSLSESQKEAILRLLETKFYNSGMPQDAYDEYLEFLRKVSVLVSCARPKVADSQYMCIVENAVDLLVDIVFGRHQSVPDKRTATQIMLLEARYLLHVAHSVYGALSKIAKFSHSFRMQCKTSEEVIVSTDAQLRISIRNVMESAEFALVHPKALFDVPLSWSRKPSYKMVSIISTTGEAIFGMDSLLCQVKYLGERIGYIANYCLDNNSYCCPEIKAKPSQKNVFVGYDTMRRILPRLKTKLRNYKNYCKTIDDIRGVAISAQLDISTHSHRGKSFISFYLMNFYRLRAMVINGKLSISTSLPSEKGLFSTAAYYLDIVCSAFVAKSAEMFIYNLRSRSRDGRRVAGRIESCTVAWVHAMLKSLCHLDASYEDAYNRRQRLRVAFRNLNMVICSSIFIGDVRRVFGEIPDANSLNHIVLGLFVCLFCSLPPTLMRNSLIELKGIFGECGKKLPDEVNDMLSMLIDLKYFCYARSNTDGRQKQLDGIDVLYPTCYYKFGEAAVPSTVTTLSKLLAYSVVYKKKVLALHVHHLDILGVLLHGCAVTGYIALSVDSNNGRVGDRPAHIVDAVGLPLKPEAQRCATKLLGVVGCCIAESVHTNKKRILKKIRRVIDIAGKLVQKRNVVSKGALDLTSTQQLRNAARAYHNKIWDNNANVGLTGEQIDDQIAAYMLLLAYTTAVQAQALIESGKWQCQHSDMPTLGCVLDDYFNLDGVPQHEAMDCVDAGKATVGTGTCALEGRSCMNNGAIAPQELVSSVAEPTAVPPDSATCIRNIGVSTPPPRLVAVDVAAIPLPPPPRHTYRTEVHIELRFV